MQVPRRALAAQRRPRRQHGVDVQPRRQLGADVHAFGVVGLVRLQELRIVVNGEDDSVSCGPRAAREPANTAEEVDNGHPVCQSRRVRRERKEALLAHRDVAVAPRYSRHPGALWRQRLATGNAHPSTNAGGNGAERAWRQGVRCSLVRRWC